jgi:hypothetical protein
MSTATATVPAICWREPLRMISAAPFTASSAACGVNQRTDRVVQLVPGLTVLRSIQQQPLNRPLPTE